MYDIYIYKHITHCFSLDSHLGACAVAIIVVVAFFFLSF